MWIMTIWRLWLEIWTSPPQCTRCGGAHTLSRCPWPAVEFKARTPGCGGACNQGRSKCTCRKRTRINESGE